MDNNYGPHYFIFREPESFDEFQALQMLRYSVYRESRLEKIVPVNEAGIDLDCWDLYSRHFGLYEHHGAHSRPVGYIRMVTDNPGTFRDEIRELVKTIPFLRKKVNRIPNQPFPMLTYFPDSGPVQKYCDLAKSRDEQVVEASRLSLERSVRGLKVATFFITALSAAFIANGAQTAIMTCVPQQRGFYSQFGFRQFDETGICYVERLNFREVCLKASINGFPQEMRSVVTGMAAIYRQFGRCCYNPADPQNFNPPLGSYLKSRTMFAPLAA